MLLDTNVVVRHLTGQPPDQARRATRFLREAEELDLRDLIVAEWSTSLSRPMSGREPRWLSWFARCSPSAR